MRARPKEKKKRARKVERERKNGKKVLWNYFFIYPQKEKKKNNESAFELLGSFVFKSSRDFLLSSVRENEKESLRNNKITGAYERVTPLLGSSKKAFLLFLKITS